MEPAEPTVPSPRFPFGLLLSLAVALTAAGLGAGFVLDATRGWYNAKLPDVAAPSEKQIREGIALQEAGFRKSGSFSGACAGAIIIGALGLVLGGASWSASRGAAGLGLGALLGAGFGAAGGYAAQEAASYTLSHAVSSTTAYFMISLAFWGPVGVGGAATAAAIGPRYVPAASRFAGPILGGVLAAILVPVIASLVFPLDYKGRIPPRGRNESLLVGGVGAALLAIGTGFTLKGRSIQTTA